MCVLLCTWHMSPCIRNHVHSMQACMQAHMQAGMRAHAPMQYLFCGWRYGRICSVHASAQCIMHFCVPAQHQTYKACTPALYTDSFGACHCSFKYVQNHVQQKMHSCSSTCGNSTRASSMNHPSNLRSRSEANEKPAVGVSTPIQRMALI